MKHLRGSIARQIILTYSGLAATIVLMSVGAIIAAVYIRQTLLVEARQRQETALLSARIRSEALLLTNATQQYILSPSSEDANRQELDDQIALLENLLQQAVQNVNPDDVDESIALGRVREHLVAFKVQSRRVLDTADRENGLGEETARQMDILLGHYQPALVESLKAFEQLETDAVERFADRAEYYAFQIGVLLILLSIVSVGLVVFMSLWLVRRFIVPLTALTENVSLSPEKAMNTPVYINTSDEMGSLARALNHMKAQINESRRRLEKYAATLEAQVEERTRELKLLAITDPLTGAYNRGHFFLLAEQSFQEARRLNHPFSIVIFDADHFKNVNDQYGHAVGDRVLKEIVQIMKSHIRQTDILGRYGGEEFVVALPNADIGESLQIMKRIAATLREAKFESHGRRFGITVSGGIAECIHPLNESLEDVLLKADKALYNAKEMGRDLVIAYNSAHTQQGDAMSELEYSPAELMIVNAARLLRDGDVVFVGVGQPNLACNLAKRTHAPNLVMIYEAGVIGAEPARLPLSIGDPTLVSGSLSVVSMYDIFANYLQRGNVDVGFMGGAQIDKYGNINATVIGAYEKPKVRLPGSGGSQEIAAWANRCYIMTPHQKRRFPERCDFRTSVGALDGGGERQRIGLRGRGMEAVVTDIGILEPDENGELMLTALHPGKTVEDAKNNTGWDLNVAERVRTTDPVTEKELRILREELDPTGIYLKGGG
jgi:glutaconate CoA-transferase subunit B